MTRLTEQEVQAAFDLMGLGTDEDRAKFTKFAEQDCSDASQDFVLLDDSTLTAEADDAELA